MKCIKTKKINANDIRKYLIKNHQLNNDYKIAHDFEYVYLPLKEGFEDSIINDVVNNFSYSKLYDYDFPENIHQPKNFVEYLYGKISNDEIEQIRKSFDIMGDIVILEIPPELENDKKIIGEAALKFTKRKSVYYKKSKVQGITRTRELEFLAGIDNLETIHKEFNLRFKLNPSTVYFSPRLATERSRIVKQVKPGEIIIDFFAGIGSFPISIAHVKEDTVIYSVDINPEAYKYTLENMKLNKLKSEVIPIEGDIHIVKDKLPKADRIIMNLPGTAKNFLPDALEKIKDGGIINYYEFATDPEIAVDSIKEVAGEKKVTVLNTRKVRSQSPGVWHIGVDCKIN